MTVSEGYPTYSPRRVVYYIYRISVVSFQEQKAFVFENDVLLTSGLGMREGVNEGSRHGSGWVIFSSMTYRHLSMNFHVLLKCVVRPLHVHLGGE